MNIVVMRRTFTFFLLVIITGVATVSAQQHSLEYYLNKGLSDNPLLRDFNNQLISGTYDSLLVIAAHHPLINLSSQAIFAPAANNVGYDSTITNGGNYTALVSITQPLFKKTQKERQFREIHLANQTIQLNSKITEIDLKKSITTQYITAYSDYGQIQFNKDILQLLQRELSVIENLADQGIYLQTDFLNLSVTVHAQQLLIKQVFQQYKNDLGILNFLCGIVDTTSCTLLAPNIPVLPELTPQLNPILKMFTLDSLKTQEARIAIDQNYRPNLNAYADAGFMTINPAYIPKHFGISIGLTLSMPIYDGNQRKHQYSKLTLNENTRLYNRQFYVRQYQQQFIQLKEQLRLTEEIIIEIKTQISEQEKLIELFQIEMEKGLVRMLDFINVINNYATTRNNLRTSEINKLQIINQLNYIK